MILLLFTGAFLRKDHDLHARDALFIHFQDFKLEICHEGVYDLNGHNVAGPPPRPLETYKVTLRGDPGQEDIVVSRQT